MPKKWPEKQLRAKLVRVAKSLIGVPYAYGAEPEEAPHFFDCSSYQQYVYKHVGVNLPRSALLQANEGKEIEMDLGEWHLKVGDLLFFRGTKGHYDDDLFQGRHTPVGHVVMYIGDGKIIHASSKDKGVAEKLLTEIREPIVMVRRIL